MAQGFNQAGSAAQRAGQGTVAWERGLATLRAQQQGFDASLAGSVRGADRVRSGLTALAVQGSGALPASDRSCRACSSWALGSRSWLARRPASPQCGGVSSAHCGRAEGAFAEECGADHNRQAWRILTIPRVTGHV